MVNWTACINIYIYYCFANRFVIKLSIAAFNLVLCRNVHGLTPVDYAKTDAMKKALNTRLDPAAKSSSSIVSSFVLW